MKKQSLLFITSLLLGSFFFLSTTLQAQVKEVNCGDSDKKEWSIERAPFNVTASSRTEARKKAKEKYRKAVEDRVKAGYTCVVPKICGEATCSLSVNMGPVDTYLRGKGPSYWTITRQDDGTYDVNIPAKTFKITVTCSNCRDKKPADDVDPVGGEGGETGDGGDETGGGDDDGDGDGGGKSVIAPSQNGVAVTSLSLSPNPAQDLLKVNYELQKEVKDLMLVVHDATGKVVLQKRMEGRDTGTFQHELNVSDLANGFFVSSLIANGRTVATEKFLVNKQ